MGYFFMFIELTTTKNEKVTFNTANIMILAPHKKGTFLVDVNGIDWIVLESYESLKEVLPSVNEKHKIG